MAAVIPIDSFRDRVRRARRATKNNPTPGRRKLAKLVAVYDHAGRLLERADPERVLQLLGDRRHTQLGTKRRIRAIRLGAGVGFELARSEQAIGGNSSLGHPTTAETWTSPGGVWSFEPIKASLRPDFSRVVESVTVHPPKRTPAPAEVGESLPIAA